MCTLIAPADPRLASFPAAQRNWTEILPESLEGTAMPSCDLIYLSPASHQQHNIENRKNEHNKKPAGQKDIILQDSTLEDVSPNNGKHTTTSATTRLSKSAKKLLRKLDNKPGDLATVSDFVKRNTEKRLPIGKSSDLYVRICDLDGTIYMGQTFMLDSWKNLYFEDHKELEVLGTLESSDGMPPFPQWVVLLGEDGCVYAYGEEEILMFAKSLSQLVEEGIQNTGISFKYPEDISDEDEEVLQQDEEIQKIREETRAFVNKAADDFQDFLDFLDS